MSGRLLTEGDVEYLRSIYPDQGVRMPTGQEELLLAHFFRGASHSAAARAAGYSNGGKGREYLQSPDGQIFLKYLQEREFQDIRVTRDSVTEMFMTAYKVAATATEMIMAARELGKLHGCYADQKTQINLNLNKSNQVALKQLGQLDERQLLEMAGPEMLELMTQAEPIDGEYSHVEDGSDE